MTDFTKTLLSPKRIALIFSVFKYFYIVSAGFLLLAAISYALVGRFPTALGIIPYAAVSGVIAYGLYKRRSWIPIVITLLAAFGIISNILRLPSAPLSALIIIAILAFEIYFFNRKDIKAKLGTRGTALF